MRIKSIITENDFSTYSTPGVAKVAEATVIANNSWAWNETYKAAHVNDSSTSLKGSFNLPLGYLKAGDKVKIHAEVMNVSGTKAKIALDSNAVNPRGVGEPAAFTFSSKNENGESFETIEIEYIVTKDAYFSVPFGTFTADVGEFYVRNCVVECSTKYNDNPKVYKQGIRTYQISGASGVFSIDDTYSPDNATLTVDGTNKFISILYGKPFETFKGVVLIGEQSTGVSPNYTIRTQNHAAGSCWIKIYDKATNTLQDPTTIVGTLSFSLFVIGYDYEIDPI